MKSPLVRNTFISALVHILLLGALPCMAYFSCRRAAPIREITTFVELTPEPAPAPPPPPLPAPAVIPEPPAVKPPPKPKKTVAVSKKLVTRSPQTQPRPRLSEEDVRRMMEDALKPAAPTRSTVLPPESYLTSVRAIMYRAWRQPSGPVGLTATVTITVNPDGRILNRRLTTPSGNPVMDASIQQAVKSVAQLPALPDGSGPRTITIDFELTSEPLL